MKSIIVFLFTTILGLFGPAVYAHQFAPSLLELVEQQDNQVSVLWKQPIVKVMGSQLHPVLPGNCRGVGRPDVEREGTGMTATWTIDCPNGLAGKTIAVEGIVESRADVLVRIQFKDQRTHTQVLTGEIMGFDIPKKEEPLSIFGGYLTLGVSHIAAGFDHLLFILGVTLIVGYGRQLLWVITAFTLGHSLTLALVTFGVVNLPPAPIELAIAASILLVALEAIRANRDTSQTQYTLPIMVFFGLLHGLGFAGALTEIGLPQADIWLALLAFNLGIEIGQIGFVIVILIIWKLLRLMRLSSVTAFPRQAAYVIGPMAVFWMLERTEAIFL